MSSQNRETQRTTAPGQSIGRTNYKRTVKPLKIKANLFVQMQPQNAVSAGKWRDFVSTSLNIQVKKKG
jgi:hypothetical protein